MIAGRLEGAADRGARSRWCVLAVVALLVGATWTFLQTRRGGELVRRLALPRVNAALAGTVALGRFAFGGDRLTLENLAIYDPEARLVARVARHRRPLLAAGAAAPARRRRARSRSGGPSWRWSQDDAGPEPGAGAGARGNRPRRRAGARGRDAGARRAAPDDRRARAGRQRRRDRVPDVRGRRRDGAAAVHLAELCDSRQGAPGGRSPERGRRVSVRGGARRRARRVRHHGQARARRPLHASAAAARAGGERPASTATRSPGGPGSRRPIWPRPRRALARDFGLPRIAMAGNGRRRRRRGRDRGGAVAARRRRVFRRWRSGTRALHGLDGHGVDPERGRSRGAGRRRPTRRRCRSGGQSLRSPTVTVHAAGRDIARARRDRGAAAAARRAARPAATGARAIAIDALSIRYPEATWTLRHRARLSFGDAIVLSGFELGADAQRLAADLRLGGAQPTAHVVRLAPGSRRGCRARWCRRPSAWAGSPTPTSTSAPTRARRRASPPRWPLAGGRIRRPPQPVARC